METTLVIVFVGFLIFLAHFFVILFDRFKIPDVLYLIIIGVAIGPIFDIVTPEDFGKMGHVFTTIALVVILFEGGLDLNIDILQRTFRRTLTLTLISYLTATILITVVLLYLTSLSLVKALFIGAVLGGPAPAVVIPLVRNLSLSKPSQTTLTLESPLGEALCIMVALAILESLKFESLNIGRVMGHLISAFIFAVIIGIIGGYIWSILLHRMRQLRNAIFTTPSFIFILYGITEFLGFSGPVTALTFGIVLGNITEKKFQKYLKFSNLTPLDHNQVEKLFFGEIVFILKTFFFVYLGLSVKFTDPWSIYVATLLTFILLASRILAIRFSTDKANTTLSDASMMAVMIPKGTAAAVLALIPLQLGLEGNEIIQNVIFSVVVISILLTAALIFLVEKKRLLYIFSIIFNGYQEIIELPKKKEKK